MVVVCKMQTRRWSDGQVLLKQRLVRKLSCCLQDPPRLARSSKPSPQNSLRQKLSCCLQGRKAAAPGRGRAVCGDSLPPPAGESHDTCASNRDAAPAISADCPGTPGGIPNRFGFCCGGNQNGGGVGNPAGCKLSVAGDRARVETAVGNNNSAGSRQRELLCLSFSNLPGTKNLESVLEF